MQKLENAAEKQRKAAEMTVRWDLKVTVTNKIGNFLHRNAFIGLLILSERISMDSWVTKMDRKCLNVLDFMSVR